MLVLAVHSFIHQGHINQNLETKSPCLCVCFFEKRAHTDLCVCFLDCVFRKESSRICVFALWFVCFLWFVCLCVRFFWKRELTRICVFARPNPEKPAILCWLRSLIVNKWGISGIGATDYSRLNQPPQPTMVAVTIMRTNKGVNTICQVASVSINSGGLSYVQSVRILQGVSKKRYFSDCRLISVLEVGFCFFTCVLES